MLQKTAVTFYTSHGNIYIKFPYDVVNFKCLGLQDYDNIRNKIIDQETEYAKKRVSLTKICDLYCLNLKILNVKMEIHFRKVIVFSNCSTLNTTFLQDEEKQEAAKEKIADKETESLR